MTERADVPDLPAVLAAYRARMARANAVDFPEMVCAAVELLLTDPAARRAEQARAHHVLLDELQDLTPAVPAARPAPRQPAARGVRRR